MNTSELRLLETGLALTGMPVRDDAGDTSRPRAAHVFVNIEIRGLGVFSGRGCIPVPGNYSRSSWLYENHEAITGAVSFRVWDTAYGHHIRSSDQTGDGQRLVDIAVADALLKANKTDFITGVSNDVFGLAPYQTGDVRGRLTARHAYVRQSANCIAKHSPQMGGTETAMSTTAPRLKIDPKRQALPIFDRILGPYEAILGGPGRPILHPSTFCLDTIAYVQQCTLHEISGKLPQDLESEIFSLMKLPGLGSWGQNFPSDQDWVGNQTMRSSGTSIPG